MKNKQEIASAIQAIEKLLKTIPSHSVFGDDNHSPLKAMIRVLNGSLTQRDFDRYDYYDRLEDVYEWMMNNGSREWLDDIDSDTKTFS